MRALEAEQHAAASNGNNGAEDLRAVHSPHQPRTRQGPHRRRLRARRRWVIACTLGAAAASLLAVELTFGAGTTARRAAKPLCRPRYSSPDRRAHRGRDGQIPRRGARRGSQPRYGTTGGHSRAAAVASPTNTRPSHSAPPIRIPLVEHDHIIDERHIRSGRLRRSRPANQAPARPRAPHPPDRVNHPQRPSRTPRPARTQARAPQAHPKPPSAHSSQEPAPAAASSPHTSNVHRKVGTREDPRHEGNRPGDGAAAPARRRTSPPLERSGLPCIGRRGRQRRQLRARGDHEQRHDRRVRRQGQRRHAPRQAPALRASSEPHRPQLGARPPNGERVGGGRT